MSSLSDIINPQDENESPTIPGWLIAVIVIAVIVIVVIETYLLVRYSKRRTERFAQLMVNDANQNAISIQRERLFQSHAKLT